ncbi:MAG: NYN domain-containing protein [Candidatus Omnitrophica bacterium]|nr:NYN domain-containing protein [Candidatus Omnitrophota bacterium]
MKIIVDGYNLINKWPGLIEAADSSIEFARQRLFEQVQAYCDATGDEAIIVYDGSRNERTIEEGSPTVVFSMKGETADTVIEALATNMTDKGSIRVVTDDRVLGNFITGLNAFVISTQLFESEIKRVGYTP